MATAKKEKSKIITEAKKRKEASEYATIMRTTLTAMNAARRIGNTMLFDNLMETYDYAAAHWKNNAMA